MSEVSHSLDSIKVEVFAEPESKVCVYGAKSSMMTPNHQEVEYVNGKLDKDVQDYQIKNYGKFFLQGISIILASSD